MSEATLCFSLSEEQQMMKDTASQLVQDLILDNAHQMDEDKTIPDEYIEKVWELGLSISPIPEEYGGYGMEPSPVLNAIILEELSAGDMAFAIAALLPNTVINTLIDSGTDEQKQKFLPSYCEGSYQTGTVAVNEPIFGFDAINPGTTAKLKGKNYILNGTKCFVPLADRAIHFLVSAMTDEGPSLFIVEKGSKGMVVGEKEKNLGIYALDTRQVIFEDCEVPAANRIGGGDAFAKFLQKSRIAISAIGTGISRASFEYARDYAKERTQFGEPIGHRQSVAFMVAEMAYEVDAMRLMTWKGASILEKSLDANKDSYLAKFYAGDMSMKITDYGVQILGGHGYIRDHPVERYYRNARGIAILEGLASV